MNKKIWSHIKHLVCETQLALVVWLMLLLSNGTVLLAQKQTGKFRKSNLISAGDPVLSASNAVRTVIGLNKNWKSAANDTLSHAFDGFEDKSFDDRNWKSVNVPHTWDQYEGYRRLLAGNRHGYAWYRKTFRIIKYHKNALHGSDQRYFLFFEGVGSYATVFLNGVKVGEHAGGRTTFTVDITNAVLSGNQPNLLSVRADHPNNIQDLPWVDGGSSTERGFSEGSQPMGIFRPVSLIITNSVKVEPFGIHVWNDNKVSTESASLKLNTELKNYSKKLRKVTVYSQLLDSSGRSVKGVKTTVNLSRNQIYNIPQGLQVEKPKLWSLKNPYLYTVYTRILENDKVIDVVKTPYGIRWISWPIGETLNKKQFLLNGKPVFINGIAEYEHLIGNSHAFSAEQIKSRVLQIKSAGFNAFRDAHQPHNVRYQEYWDRLGILSWTQLAAHVWYNTPEFRKNFKNNLREWVKERRNSPSIVLWGLENESTLPEDFARECTAIIREMDPTASSQRKVTTCNGGKGTDWDVPQNWTGTYGGDPLDYAKDIERQVLVGEYGAWRTLDLHTEGPFNQNGVNSENKMAQLMETKIRLAEQAKDKTAGHFFWLFNSHDNPGRVQGGEGLRELDRVGPVNYKGLLTPWEEPLDVYHLFRANYAPKKTSPMVYIVSHTWPERWLKVGIKDSITVYSNCDEVELFNDVNKISLGKHKRNGIGTHFQWDRVKVDYNVLYAVGYVDGKPVAKDYIVLNFLPQSPDFKGLYKDTMSLLPEKGYKYLYRVNAGGPDYVDTKGNLWSADRQRTSKENWGSTSWTADFPGTPAYFASQRRTFDPIKGTADWKLFQTFRFGRDKLKFEFPVPDGEYLVELYFIEPWLGTGGGEDCTGWRLFDVAVNDQVFINDLDIWKEAGHDSALKKTIKVKVTGGQLSISFPEVKAGQALISAIAIATTNAAIKPAAASPSLVGELSLNKLGINEVGSDKANLESIKASESIRAPESIKVLEFSQATAYVKSWMDIGEDFSALPSELFGVEWFKSNTLINQLSFRLTADALVYIAPEIVASEIVTSEIKSEIIPKWLTGFEDTKTFIVNNKGEGFKVYKKRYQKGDLAEFQLAQDSAIRLTVAIAPTSSLAPAYDLKSATNYIASKTFPSAKGVTLQSLMGKDRLTFKSNEGSMIEFKINVGVADTYSLTLKYHNPFEKDASAVIEVLALDGTVMKREETILLSPTKTGKWNYFNTNTGTMINAGTYLVRLKAIDAINVSIDGLEVQ